jgi:hypothetical protein
MTMKYKEKKYYNGDYIDAIIAALDEISDKLGEFEKRISLLENAANKSE